QAHDEAGAEDAWFVLAGIRILLRAGAGAVLRPDAPAMGFDDLLGNRQAETGILAEALMRSVGVEALENLLQSIRADAGSFVIDGDLDLVLQLPAGDAHGAARGRERARIV